MDGAGLAKIEDEEVAKKIKVIQAADIALPGTPQPNLHR